MIKEQKAIKVGNSVAVVLSSEAKKKLNIKAGDTLYSNISENQGRVEFYKEAPAKEYESVSDAELAQYLKEADKEYSSVMKKLAKN